MSTDTEHSNAEQSQKEITASAEQNESDNEQAQSQAEQEDQLKSYTIRFRDNQQFLSATSRIQNLNIGEVAMIQTDHGLEPAKVVGFGPIWPLEDNISPRATFTLVRRANREEIEKYDKLVNREKEAYQICQKFIEKHKLEMKLICVERFFNGSKIIFYFTAENRVDFRELVKDLVQEFRTRVEMRQIGVRHETKMVGGLGCCGRELCCSSYLKNFAPVSIKMAKEQDLPLNPAKISGICNRLLCCLTYEYDHYHKAKKKMPRVGHNIKIEGKSYKVLQQNILQQTLQVADLEDHENVRTLIKEEWQKATFEDPKKSKKKKAENKQ